MDTGRYLREMRRQERREALEDLVATYIKGLLLIEDGEELPLDQGYFDLGLTSLRLGEVRTYLQQQLDLEIDATVLFSRPTVDQLVDHLTDALTVPQTDGEACDAA
ncbi:MAG TPA: acyl carrier protein [Actinocrinis sp.]|jgi:acyl carrier protein